MNIDGLPLAAVLAIVLSKSTSSLWGGKDPHQAHRRFGPGADNEVFGTVPRPQRYVEPKPRTGAEHPG